jgi:ATP-dependent Lon protease
MDPLIILDEIDKTPMRGSYSPVTAAFLEILDPQQNTSFSDRYLELPIDLSKVLFICTANEEEDIPPALKDRMEIIRFREYTKDERRIILTKYMIPNIYAEYNLLTSPYDYDIKFADEAIETLIEEVQLRQIELRVRRILKKAVTSIYLHGTSKVLIDAAYLKEQTARPIRTTARIGF